MKPLVTLLIRNAEQVVTARTGGRPARYSWRAAEILPGGSVACAGDRIVAVGTQEEVLRNLELSPHALVIDAVGCAVTPGLVDCHAHPVWAGSRVDEFEERIRGVSYEEISRRGGGIQATVAAVRRASEEELVTAALRRLDIFLSCGTTTLEAKSGYGLSTEHELRLLRVIQRLRHMHPVELVPTFLGAHTVPEEYRGRREQYVELLVNEMIPAVASGALAEFCDVFCEAGFFSPAESERILLAGKDHGLRPKIHAEQLSRSGGSPVAAAVGAVSADHLDWCEEEDLHALAQAGVVPVNLPGATCFLGKERYAPARRMIEMDMPVAIATDFNPGTAPIFSLPLVGSFSCLRQGLTPAEALSAMTLGGAWALARQDEIGTLEEGKRADLVVWPTKDYREIFYYLGSIRPRWVVKNGRIVYQSADESSLGHRGITGKDRT